MQELVRKNRSYRRFDEGRPISAEQLDRWVTAARFSASAMNAQPLRYILSTETSTNERILPLLKWAGYLSDWDGPQQGERPTAYVVVLRDTEIKVKPEFVWCDVGLTSQNMLLSAAEEGFGGCIIASVNGSKLREALEIDDRYEPLVVLALGAPAEDVRIVNVAADGSIKYYRDERDAHVVPKRPLEELVIAKHW
jgi:nitroreductase